MSACRCYADIVARLASNHSYAHNAEPPQFLVHYYPRRLNKDTSILAITTSSAAIASQSPTYVDTCLHQPWHMPWHAKTATTQSDKTNLLLCHDGAWRTWGHGCAVTRGTTESWTDTWQPAWRARETGCSAQRHIRNGMPLVRRARRVCSGSVVSKHQPKTQHGLRAACCLEREEEEPEYWLTKERMVQHCPCHRRVWIRQVCPRRQYHPAAPTAAQATSASPVLLLPRRRRGQAHARDGDPQIDRTAPSVQPGSAGEHDGAQNQQADSGLSCELGCGKCRRRTWSSMRPMRWMSVVNREMAQRTARFWSFWLIRLV